MTENKGTESDPNVVRYRLEKMRRAPLNWINWIGAATAVNGLMLMISQNLQFPLGFITPYLISGFAPHLLVAFVVLILGYVARDHRKVVHVVYTLYVLDLVLCVFLEFWSGVALHIIVFVFVGLALNGARALEATLVKQPTEVDN